MTEGWEKVREGRWQHTYGDAIQIVDGFETGSAVVAGERYRVHYYEDGGPIKQLPGGPFSTHDDAEGYAVAVMEQEPRSRATRLDDWYEFTR